MPRAATRRSAAASAATSARFVFSAPCNIGPPLPGAAPGGVLEVEGDTPNAGRYVIESVDANWMSITKREIDDHVPAPGVTVRLVREAAP